MTNQSKTSKGWNIRLWIAQSILAAIFIWAAYMKLFTPTEKLALMWPWAAQVPQTLLKFTGIVDLTGALGLILPGLFHIKPKLTPIAALCIIVLMAVAITFHVSRGESSVIGANIIFAVIAAFIAWGRFKKVPL
jgi:uncharacterized membrane protein YphA (DoxX/SURF4 family)